ncbi:MAG: diphthine--ammonia ligase [Solirubrobacterales bacterium]|nr:diphthine--ammonia ligase [Solirubrobacterales bacterium]
MDVSGLRDLPVFCSWSGGKDSALALHEAIRAGAEPRLLVTMLTEDGIRSRSHGLHRSVLEAQSDALGVPIRFVGATWADYEPGFAQLVGAAVESGASTGVFGDIDIAGHREWVEGVCGRSGASACLPLWNRDRADVVSDLLDTGFKAVVVAVRDQVLPESLLGRVIDREVLGEISATGADPAGEHGEYHSLVTDGPMFKRPLEVEFGEVKLADGVLFRDVRVAD